ncbi:MAG TPA: protein kinase [Polyangiaceae bacterium LLY-WYZ-14_1]|nr:protein kinase [Polyangiaceae bacterium LLY-WYZ-14_1]
MSPPVDNQPDPGSLDETVPDDGANTGSGARQRSSSSHATLPPNALLEGIYRIRKEIGHGAMGTVYEVEHETLGRRFAAKVLSPLLTRNEVAVRRLQNEARAASAIDHDNIVDVTHFGRSEDGLVYVVMELLRGRDLGARLAEARHAAGDRPAPLPDDEVREVVAQVLDGLDAAHRAQIVHRDLKPENVFLADAAFGPPRAVIVDFGISKLLDTDEAGRLTGTGQILGTPLYMAPEQTGGGQIDGRTDLYSMGVMIYEVLTGTTPFDGSNLLEILYQHAHRAPTPLAELRPDLPAKVSELVHRALAKDPADRFPDAATMSASWRAAWRGNTAPVAKATLPNLLGRRGVVFLGAAAAVAGGGALLAAVLGREGAVDSSPATMLPGSDAVRRAPGAARSPTQQEPPIDTPGDGPGPRASSSPRDAEERSPSPGSADAPAKNGAGPAAPGPADAVPRRARTVESVPSGARVFRGGRSLGQTPLEVTLPPGGRARLELRHPGYEPERVTLTRDSEEVLRVVLQRRPPPLAPL